MLFIDLACELHIIILDLCDVETACNLSYTCKLLYKRAQLTELRYCKILAYYGIYECWRNLTWKETHDLTFKAFSKVKIDHFNSKLRIHSIQYPNDKIVKLEHHHFVWNLSILDVSKKPHHLNAYFNNGWIGNLMLDIFEKDRNKIVDQLVNNITSISYDDGSNYIISSMIISNIEYDVLIISRFFIRMSLRFRMEIEHLCFRSLWNYISQETDINKSIIDRLCRSKLQMLQTVVVTL